MKKKVGLWGDVSAVFIAGVCAGAWYLHHEWVAVFFGLWMILTIAFRQAKELDY